MAFTTYATWVAGAILTAAQLNQQVRDNGNVLKTTINDDGTLNPIRRLTANSGSSTSAAAATLDSIALSGLTALDYLQVEFAYTMAVNGTAACNLYHVTDAVSLLTTTGIFNGDEEGSGTYWLSQDKKSTTLYSIHGSSYSDAHAAFNSGAHYAAAAAWTANWTLGLRFPGITAGGTCYWRWAVYLFRGQ